MGKYERKNTGDAFGALIAIAMALVFCLMITLCTGCKTRYITQEVPVIVHERDSIYKVNTLQVHDTLHTMDSVYHYVKGDTTIIERWHTIHSINNINRTDTIVQVEEKEIPVPYPKPYPVEKELTFWERTRMKAGSLFLLCLVGGALFGGWKIYRKIKG